MIQVGKESFFVLMVTLINSCALSKYERTNELTKYKDDFYWSNTVNSLKVDFYTDSAYNTKQGYREYRYEGLLIIDNRDTLYLRGYEKGGMYPSWVNGKSKNTTNHSLMDKEEEKVFFIHQSSKQADTLFFKNTRLNDSIPTWTEFYLLKKSK